MITESIYRSPITPVTYLKDKGVLSPSRTVTLGIDGQVWELRRRSFIEFVDFKPNPDPLVNLLHNHVQTNFLANYYSEVEQTPEHLAAIDLMLENWRTVTGLLSPLANKGSKTPFCYPEVKFTCYNTRRQCVNVDLVGTDTDGHVYLVEVGTTSKRKRLRMAEELQAFGQHFPEAAVSGVVALYGDRDEDRLFLDLDIMRPQTPTN